MHFSVTTIRQEQPPPEFSGIQPLLSATQPQGFAKNILWWSGAPYRIDHKVQLPRTAIELCGFLVGQHWLIVTARLHRAGLSGLISEQHTLRLNSESLYYL
jgi:hypothetical protein